MQWKLLRQLYNFIILKYIYTTRIKYKYLHNEKFEFKIDACTLKLIYRNLIYLFF